MTITVLDSDTAMREILAAPLPTRAEAARGLLDQVVGMYRYFPGEVDVVEMHHMGSGFRLDADDHRVGRCTRATPQSPLRQPRLGSGDCHGR